VIVRRGSNRWWAGGSLVLAALALLAVSCARASSPGGGTAKPKSLPALKLAVLSAVGGRLSYCDPDEYPIPRGAPFENAQLRFEAIKKDRAAFTAILEHEHLRPDQNFTPEQIIAISNLYKQMQAIQLQPAGDGYRFTVLVVKAASKGGTELVSGTVSRSGRVKIERRGSGKRPECPICLAMGDRVATPLGDVLVQDIRVRMPVWTTDLSGRRILGVVLRTGRMQSPLGHQVVRVTLADGRTVVASPGHPTADGRAIGALEPGDQLDGSRVLAAVLLDYAGEATFDLLPSGPTGTYFVNGVLLGSTLSVRAT
jgi:hypothetical protein